MEGTLVVGLDGATWTVVDPLLERGKLPNLSEILSTGVRGELESTLPPMTPPAWTSIATGVGPGRHGVYGFRDVDPDTYALETVGSETVSRPALWDLFDAHNRSIGVVNYPIVRPPPKVDGFFVSGFPGTDDDPVAHPEDVEADLDARDYRVQPRRRPTEDPEAYFEEVRKIASERCRATIDLYEQYDIELLWPVFMAIDWVQHYLWTTEIGDRSAVDRIYEHLDAQIGRLLDAVGDDWDVVVLSDHGFRPIDGEIHMNAVLEDGGYLHRSDSEGGGVGTVLGTLWSIGHALPFRLRERAKQATPAIILEHLRRSAGMATSGLEDVDWPDTTAFSAGAMGRIYLNRTEAHPAGTLSESEESTLAADLGQHLGDLTDPDGDPVFERVRRGAELYGPDAAGRPPDLLAQPTDWRYTLHGDFYEQWFTAPRERVADHHPTGIIAVSGDGVNADEVNADVTAVPALLSALHDLPVFDDVDETLLMQCGLAEKVSYVSPDDVGRTEIDARAGPGEGVEERLELLGYR